MRAERLVPLVGLLCLALPAIMILSMRSRSRGARPSGPCRPAACYYLTNVDDRILLRRRFDIIIVEPDEVSPETVRELKKRGVLVLAYINLGYAEAWRDYWSAIRKAPWVHEETAYTDEYFVEYWRDEWLSIVIRYAEKCLERGFGGIYLDNIDACVILEERRPAWARGVNLTEAMIEVVRKVSNAIKARHPDAKVFANIGGAVRLLADERFISCIDGVLREEVWYTVDEDGHSVRIDPQETMEALKYLEIARKHGKVVIVVDFVESMNQAWEFYEKARKYGFIPIPQPCNASDYSQPPPPQWYR